mgnify:CR=1 FL=1
MKHLLSIFALIFTLSNISAQETYDLKSKHDLREFDEFQIENDKTEKSVTRIPALLKSSIVNSNPEFVSASSDSVYEDSTYLFNVLTNDPDGDPVSVSISSKPSWISFASKEGGKINDVTNNWSHGNNFINGKKATDLLISTGDAMMVYDLEIFNGEIYFSADTYIGKIKADGTVEVVAGQYGLDNVQVNENSKVDTTIFDEIISFTHDSDGNLFVGDYNNGDGRVYKIDSNGTITTVAGGGGDDGESGVREIAATSWKIYSLRDIIFDENGILYVITSAYIFKVGTNNIVTRYGGNGSYLYTGDGGLATSASFYTAETVFDTLGNLYFSDTENHVIRKIDTNGIITTIVGDGSSGYTGDGGLATSAKINKPRGLIFDSNGALYFSGSGNHVIRKINEDGIISTFAGTGIAGGVMPSLNPAMNVSKKSYFQFSLNRWLGDIKGSQTAYHWGQEISQHITIQSWNAKDLQLWGENPDYTPLGTFGVHYVSAAYSISHHLSTPYRFGVRIQTNYTHLFTESMNGITLDLGALFPLSSFITAGFVVRNLGYEYTNNLRADLPLEVGIGTVIKLPIVKTSLLTDLMYNNINQQELRAAISTNWKWLDFYAGTSISENRNAKSMGFSFKYRNWKINYGIYFHENSATLGTPVFLDVRRYI